MYVNRPQCSEICLQKTSQFHLRAAHREELLGCKGFWVFGGEGGGERHCGGQQCFLRKGGFPLQISSLSAVNVNHVAVGPVQMPQRGEQMAETIETSQIYNLRQQIGSHSCWM